MDQTIQDLFTILSDHLYQRKTTITPTKEVLDLAKSHSLDGIVAYQCPNLNQNALAASVFYYKNRQVLVQQIEKVLEENNLNYFLVKGTTIAKYYPVPALRTMGDSDIIVENKQLVCQLLEPLGFKLLNQGGTEWVVEKNNIKFEIHDHLIYEDLVDESLYIDYFYDVFNHIDNHQLNWNIHFIFLIVHLRKHIIHNGVGLRQFYDLAVLIMYHSDAFDWKIIQEDLLKLNLMQFFDICLKLIQKWFDVSAPIEVKDITDEFYLEATDMIIHNGTFGFDNEKNIQNYSMKIMDVDNYKKSFLKNTVRLVFPDYETMCGRDYLSFMYGRPYLLVFGWVYRIFYCLFIDNKIKTAYKKVMISKDSLQERKDKLNRWGL